MADTLNITANVTEGQAVSSSVDEGVTISSNVVESTTVTANVVTGAKGDPGDPATNLVTSVNGKQGTVVLDADDIDDTSTTHKFVTSADLTTLSNTSGTNTGDQDLSGYALTSSLATVATTGDYDDLTNKPTIPDSLDDLSGDSDDISEGSTNLFFSSAEQSKLSGIEALADVTDATNVAAAGAVMTTGNQTIAGSKTFTDNVMTTGKLLKINADSGNPEFDFTESGTVRAKTYYDVANNRLTFQNNENNNADAIYFTDHITTTGNITPGGNVDGRDVAADGSKLDGIEANADVTDATNVDAAGATMNTDTTLAGNSYFLDEDTMSSNSATKVPSQQSVKAYVDNSVITDHGALSGLSDDDHTQYALLAGRSGGQTLRGGTSKTNNLVLSANSQAYDNKSYGYIETTHPIVWNDNINIGATFTGFFSEGYHRFISQTGTFTLDPAMNAGEVSALKSAVTIKYSSSQIITASPTFMSQNTIQPTAAVSDNALASWSSYIANDRFMPLLTTAITATTTNFVGLQSAPTVGIAAGSHASASGVATNLIAVEAASKVTSQGTATNARGVLVHNPIKEGSGVVTNNIGVDIESMTSGSTLNVGLRIAPSTSTGAQAIQITGTPTTAAGGITFGTDTNLYRSAANTLKTDDTLDAAAYKVAGTAGADGSFTTVDGKTVTVSKGLITAIT